MNAINGSGNNNNGNNNNGNGSKPKFAIAPGQVDKALSRFEERQKQREAFIQAAEQLPPTVQIKVTVGQVLDEVLVHEGDYTADDIANGIVRLAMLAQTYGMNVADMCATIRFLKDTWQFGVYTRKPEEVVEAAQD